MRRLRDLDSFGARNQAPLVKCFILLSRLPRTSITGKSTKSSKLNNKSAKPLHSLLPIAYCFLPSNFFRQNIPSFVNGSVRVRKKENQHPSDEEDN